MTSVMVKTSFGVVTEPCTIIYPFYHCLYPSSTSSCFLSRKLPDVSEACRYWLAENLGATCCSGSDSCRNSQLALNEATASCSNDACCAGKNSCVKATLTGIDSLSCRGEGACWDASAVLTGNLYCDSSGTIGGACSSSEAAFTFKGGQHCLECYGERTCAFQSEFIFMPGSGSFSGNVVMKCGSSASSTETCAEAQVQLLEETCLHLHCAKNTCQNLAVIINAGESSKCYCEGAFFSRVGGGNQFSKTVSKELHQSLGVNIKLCFRTFPPNYPGKRPQAV